MVRISQLFLAKFWKSKDNEKKNSLESFIKIQEFGSKNKTNELLEKKIHCERSKPG